MSFKKWIIGENINYNIEISYDNVDRTLIKKRKEIIESEKIRREKIEETSEEKLIEIIEYNLLDYPNKNQLILSIKNAKNNLENLKQEYNKLWNWIKDNSKYELRKILSQIWLYEEKISDYKFDESELEVYLSREKENSIKEAEEIKNIILKTISNIKGWNNSKITIEVYLNENKEDVSFYNSYFIELGSNLNFSLFYDEGKIEIDDVLESGDEDFFDNVKEEEDYFNLINELKNYGRKKENKVLTLYTARPKKDRMVYLDAKTLPKNIFLTNSYSHAEGLAYDLADKNEPRDIWKVKINQKYLTQTLDGPIKYYQVTSNNAEVITINLA